MGNPRKVFVWLLLSALILSISGTNVWAGHFALAFQRMKPYYENGLGDQFWIWVWDENGNPMPYLDLYNSWGTLMGTTNYDGQAKIPILAGEERIFDILCVDGQGSTSDVTNLVTTRFYPDWGHYGFECGFIYKTDVNNPGTFDLSMNCTWPQENDVNWDEAPYTESLAYHSVDCTDYHSDERVLGITGHAPGSYYGQTFVANGDRVISAKAWGAIGGNDLLSWKCQIVTFPDLIPVGPISQTPHEWPFTWMVYWGVNDNPVTPGQTYMLKVWRDEYDPDNPGMNMYRTINDVYPDGIFYEGTTPFPNNDMWGYIVCMNPGDGGDDDEGYTDSVVLSGYWPLDETAGDTAADSSGNGHDGTRQGDATWANGKVKGGLCLDGASDYVDLGDSRRLKPALPLTMAAWIKLAVVGNFQILINLDKKDHDSSHRLYGPDLLVWNTGELVASFGDGQPNYSGRYKIGATALQPDTWYHVAAVIRGTDDMSLYVNGQDDGGTPGGAGDEIAYSDGDSQLGSRNGNQLFLNGCIDDAVLFDVALTPEEIYRLYKLSGQSFATACGDVMLQVPFVLAGDVNKDCRVDLRDYVWLAQEWLRSGSPLLADVYVDPGNMVNLNDLFLMRDHWLEEVDGNLIGYWKLDDGSGSDAQDSAFYENHGQLNGDAIWTTGHLGGAISFDGDGDYIDLGDSSSLKSRLPITLAAWVQLVEVGDYQILINVDNKVFDAFHRIYGPDLFVMNTGELVASFGDGEPDYNSRYKTGVTALQPNTWYHVAAVIRGAEDISLYIDGQDDGGVYGGSGGAMVYADGPAQIGCRNGNAFFLHGDIDEVRIYNRALSAQEIGALANP